MPCFLGLSLFFLFSASWSRLCDSVCPSFGRPWRHGFQSGSFLHSRQIACAAGCRAQGWRHAGLCIFRSWLDGLGRKWGWMESTNGRVFIQSWRWDPPELLRKIPSFSQKYFGNFLSGGYPNRSSGIHRWGLDLSTGYPNAYFSWFSGYPQLTLVFLPGDENFRIFFLRCLSRKSGSQHQVRIKTLPSSTDFKAEFPLSGFWLESSPENRENVWGEAFWLMVGALLFTVELLCLQSVEVLIRGRFLHDGSRGRGVLECC